MPTAGMRNTILWQLWQLLAPDAKEFGKGFETEIRRLGVIGLQFAAVVSIVLPCTALFVDLSIWYLNQDRSFLQFLSGNLQNFGIVLIGISGLSLSRTTLGEQHANAVVIGCTILAESIATAANLVQASSVTYAPFVIALLILTAVVPLRPVTVLLVGFAMIGLNYLLHWSLVESVDSVAAVIASVSAPFLSTITLVCAGLTTMIYRLRLKNYQNLEALRESQSRLQKELATAGIIQMHSLPRANPKVEGFSVAGACLSATEVGGDYYDYLEFSDGKLGVVVGDVSGKGTSAALYMSKLQGIVRALKHLHQKPAHLLTAVNDLIYGSIEKNSFITVTYAFFELQKRQVTVSRAGHNPLLHFKADGNCALRVPPGIGIGLAPRHVFQPQIQEAVYKLESREVLVLYTDGVTEARNLAGQEYGESRLVRFIKENLELEARAMSEKIIENVKAFVGPAQQHDDMTVIVVKVN